MSDPRTLLHQISALFERKVGFSYDEIVTALDGDESELWAFLRSNTLWGGSGSIADQALLDYPDDRTTLEELLVELGKEQMMDGRTNVRTEMWVTAFDSWHKKNNAD